MDRKSELKTYLLNTKRLLDALEDSGLFASPKLSTKRKKEGYLDFYKNDEWKQYYFVLLKESLCYFRIGDKVNYCSGQR